MEVGDWLAEVAWKGRDRRLTIAMAMLLPPMPVPCGMMTCWGRIWMAVWPCIFS
jgi:hypothetical protein